MAELLEVTLRRLPNAKRIKEQMIIDAWPRVAGNQIDLRTEPLFIKDGILFVLVQDSVWAQHLSLQKRHLITRLNREARTRMLKDLRFQAGGLSLHPKIPALSQKINEEEVLLDCRDYAAVERALQESRLEEELGQAVREMLINNKKYLRRLFAQGCRQCARCGMPVYPWEKEEMCHCCRVEKELGQT